MACSIAWCAGELAAVWFETKIGDVSLRMSMHVKMDNAQELHSESACST